MNDPILHPTADRLQAYVEKALDAADFAVVDSHLNGCPQCQSEVAEWRSLFTMLATLPQYAPQPDFANRVMAQVRLADPWHVRVAARVSNRVQVFVPKTTRGWAAAAALLALPAMLFVTLAYWLLSKPYITPGGLVAFTYERVTALASSFATDVLAGVLQTDVALYVARGLGAVSDAGLGAAGALFAAVAMATALSAWVLYQNLFRTTTRENRSYVSYSF